MAESREADPREADPPRLLEFARAQDAAREHWEAGCELYNKLRFETAQLDLIAGRPVCDAAAKLIQEHEGPRMWVRPTGGAHPPPNLFYGHMDKITGLHTELLNKARADLGLPASDR